MLFLFLKKSTFPKFPFNFPIFCPAYNNTNNKWKLMAEEGHWKEQGTLFHLPNLVRFTIAGL